LVSKEAELRLLTQDNILLNISKSIFSISCV
jgi:hypothetical protein